MSDGKYYEEGTRFIANDGEYILQDVAGKPRWIKLDQNAEKYVNNCLGDTYYPICSVADFITESTIVPAWKFID